MSRNPSDRVFSDSIARLYEAHLVPLIFEPYAAELAARVGRAGLPPAARVLEIAAGTGVVTRRLAQALPATVRIVATDLNQAMLDFAAEVGVSRPVEWRQADAMALPFEDASFDFVLCQFGVMFFPEKAKAFGEVRRVLRPGGTFLFNTWDRLEENEIPQAVDAALAVLFPDDPPRFLARTPHGYHDIDSLRADLARGGLDSPARIDTVAARSQAASARIPAIGFCKGTPLRNEIEARGAMMLDQATDAVAQAVAERFSPGPVDGKIQAHVVTVRR